MTPQQYTELKNNALAAMNEITDFERGYNLSDVEAFAVFVVSELSISEMRDKLNQYEEEIER